MWKAITRFCAALGAAVILAVVVGLTVRAMRTGSVPSRTVLELDLEGSLVEWQPDDPLSRLVLGEGPRLRDVLDALERAASDDRVRVLVARLGTGPMGLAQRQELRDAVLAFRRSGKRALVFAESLGEMGPATGAYYLATAFDEIWLQPSGQVALTGAHVETPFVRGTLDKLGVVPRLEHRKAYKTARNLFTERAFTPEHREMIERILASQLGQIVRGIATARGMDEAAVRELCDRGPFAATEALAARLVDRLGYRDEVWAAAEEAAGGEATPLLARRYLAMAGRPNDRGEVIALVHAVGTVRQGRSRVDPTTGAVSLGSDSVVQAIEDAVRDDAVRAIVLRVDSPGGSYVASDAIWRAVRRARERGRPVIATMGDVAGSGGYFLAMNADRIVAQPGTLTGSIGVVAGKFVTRALWDRLGVTWDEVVAGEHATMWSSLHDFTPSQQATFDALLDTIYADFTAKVAAARSLSATQVEAVAQGRVWTGEDALARGLVDELGGYETALRLARAAANLPPDAPIALRAYPPRRRLVDAVLARLAGEDDEEEPVAIGLQAVREHLQRVAPVARALGLVSWPGLLSVPPALRSSW